MGNGQSAPSPRHVQWAYVTLAVLWVLLLIYLRVRIHDVIAFGILAFPVVIFAVGFVHATHITEEEWARAAQIDYLSVGLLVVVPLLAWMSRQYSGQRAQFVRILVIAVAMTMLGTVDVWVGPALANVLRHIRSAIQTAAIALILYALYVYYINEPRKFFTETL